MKQEIKRVRAHHGMCLCFFKGKGYSSDFTENMWDALEYLQKENPVVEIVDWDDHICASCPNLLTIIKTEDPSTNQPENQMEDLLEKDPGKKEEEQGKNQPEEQAEEYVKNCEEMQIGVRHGDGCTARMENTPDCKKACIIAEKACITAEKVARYDQGVLRACNLKSGAKMHWLDYRALVVEKVIQSGKREKICGDCSWNELCKYIAEL